MHRLIRLPNSDSCPLRSTVLVLLDPLKRSGDITMAEIYKDGTDMLYAVYLNSEKIASVFDNMLPACGINVEIYHTSSSLHSACKDYVLVDTSCVKPFTARAGLIMMHNGISSKDAIIDIVKRLPAPTAAMDDETLLYALKEAACVIDR